MTPSREEVRQTFIDAWQKQRNQQPLTDLEKILVTIISAHPEYHAALTNDHKIAQDFTTDNNPFLHLGLHVSLAEQLQTNRPAGIQAIYQQLIKKLGDTHQAEHLMMDVMGELLWQAQQNGKLASNEDYIAHLQKLLR